MVPAGVVDADARRAWPRICEPGDIVDRRRQLATTATTSAAPAELRRAGHPLRRLRHQRRRLGPRARLLPDDRRRGRGGRAASTPIFARSRPGVDAAPRTPGRTGDPAHRGGGLSPLRADRRRSLREDGPQRHRVRDHGRLRRGAEHPAPRQRRQRRPRASTPRPRRCATPSTTSTTSTCRRSPRSGGAAASSRSWLLDLTARGARASDPTSAQLRRPRVGLRRGPLDRARGDRRRRADAGADAGAVRALHLARRDATSPTGCSRRCASSSAATTRSSRPRASAA